jgi:hypothetical protein
VQLLLLMLLLSWLGLWLQSLIASVHGDRMLYWLLLHPTCLIVFVMPPLPQASDFGRHCIAHLPKVMRYPVGDSPCVASVIRRRITRRSEASAKKSSSIASDSVATTIIRADFCKIRSTAGDAFRCSGAFVPSVRSFSVSFGAKQQRLWELLLSNADEGVLYDNLVFPVGSCISCVI